MNQRGPCLRRIASFLPPPLGLICLGRGPQEWGQWLDQAFLTLEHLQQVMRVRHFHSLPWHSVANRQQSKKVEDHSPWWPFPPPLKFLLPRQLFVLKKLQPLLAVPHLLQKEQLPPMKVGQPLAYQLLLSLQLVVWQRHQPWQDLPRTHFEPKLGQVQIIQDPCYFSGKILDKSYIEQKLLSFKFLKFNYKLIWCVGPFIVFQILKFK